MDLFLGSTPRKFVSFYLEQETGGQPNQDLAELKKTEITELSANNAVPDLPTSSKLSIAEPNTAGPNQLLASVPLVLQGQQSSKATDARSSEPQTSEEPANNNLSSEEIMDTGRGQSQTRCASDIVRQLPQEDMDAESSQPQTPQEPNRDRPRSQECIDAESSQPHTRVEDSPLSKLLGSDGSESNESCQAFFTRTMQELGTETVEEEIPEGHEPLPKESESEPLTIAPAQEKVKPPERLQQKTPDVSFLDVPKICQTSSSSSAISSPLKRAKVVDQRSHPMQRFKSTVI